MPATVLSSAQLDTFARDGFLVVRGLYGAGEMQTWKERIVERMRREGGLDEPSGVRVWMPDRFDPYLLERMRDPQVVEILRGLLGPHLEFLSAKPVFKDASHTFASPWHQDWFYWKGSHKLSIWIALDAADAQNGCLKMVPGSHRRVFDMVQVQDGHGFGHRVAEEDLRDLPVQSLEVERGDAVFFHDLALHASHPNASGRDRWSFISTYRDGARQDEATVWKQGLIVCGDNANNAAPFPTL